MRRLFGFFALALSALLPWGAPAFGQSSWPNRPITLVVGFAAGGGADVLARIVAKRLSEVLGQQVIIENVGGAGGMVGTARVAKSPPDGYTIVLGTRADAINQTLYKKPLYNLLDGSSAGRADRGAADHPPHPQRRKVNNGRMKAAALAPGGRQSSELSTL